MKYLMAVPAVFLLASCDSFRQTVQDPEVQQLLIQTGKDAAAQAMTGNFVGAGGTAGLGILTFLGLWLRKRMKNSAPGEIIGGSKPA